MNAPARPVVLVIDDEMSIRAALKRFFERRGWDMLEAEDGVAGSALLLGPNPPHVDVIVCDLKMPGVTGIELYHRLERERPELVRRMVLSTGDVASPDAARFLATTTCPVLEKPFELPVLAAAVEDVRQRAGQGG